MEQLQQHISRAWVKEGLTIFADDHWAAWKIEDRQTLRQALRGIQTVIKVLEDNGLQINAKKSAILYDLKGKDVMKEMGTYVQKTDSGKCMLMQSCQGQIAIPIKKSHEYLGTVFAYRDSQNLNLQHRLGKSRGQYASLKENDTCKATHLQNPSIQGVDGRSLNERHVWTIHSRSLHKGQNTASGDGIKATSSIGGATCAYHTCDQLSHKGTIWFH